MAGLSKGRGVEGAVVVAVVGGGSLDSAPSLPGTRREGGGNSGRLMDCENVAARALHVAPFTMSLGIVDRT